MRTLLAVVLSWVALQASANPTLLRDVNTTAPRQASGLTLTPALTPFVTSIVASGGVAYFNGTDPVRGAELWRTDGTAAGTSRVADINPFGSSFPNNLVDAGGTLFFFADNGSDGFHLWKSDGTAAGTVQVSAWGGTASPAQLPTFIRYSAGLGLVFFLTNERPGSGGGTQLWRSDGTTAGTYMLRRLEGFSFGPPTVSGGRLFFGDSSAAEGGELWSSDGTVAGTALVRDINPGVNSSNPGNFVDVGGILYFAAFDGTSGQELWRSDGTAAGTFLVLNIAPGGAPSSPSQLTNVGGTLYFFATYAANRRELWKSDGTAAGTVMVTDLTNPASSASPVAAWSAGGALYFTIGDAAAGTELWRSDGTAAGTQLVLDINPGPASSSVSELVDAGGVVYFKATDASGTELWRTDGTAAGTMRARDIAPGASSSTPSQLAALGSLLLFSADDAGGNRELWRSDGTLAGTFQVLDINPSQTSSIGGFFGPAGSNVLFAADDGVAGNELWTTDGTPAGTLLARDINPGAPRGVVGSSIRLGAFHLFAADDGVNGIELWSTDGTAAGTMLVKDINPGAASSVPQRFTEMGGVVYFTATEPGTGTELWRTDGTTAGTTIVRDIAIGAASSNPFSTFFNFPKAGGRFYFIADDGVNGQELWSSDGTAAGTSMLDLTPGSGGSSVTPMGAAGTALLFLRNAAVVPPFGTLPNIELWRTDGTPAGTAFIRTFVNNAGPPLWVELGGALHFIANDGVSGLELWRSDGTAAGTTLVRDIVPGINGSQISRMGLAGGLMWFAASDGVNGLEMWRSDGTFAGTFMVADINPGPAGSGATVVGEFGGRVYLSAFDPVNGLQIWSSTGSGGAVRETSVPMTSVGSMGPVPTGLVLALNDGVRGVEPWILTIGDGTPDAFSFPTANDVLPGSQAVSAAVTPTGYTLPVPVTVSGGEYSVNCTSSFTSSAGALTPGQSICVRHTASTNLSSGVTTTLNVGGTAATFTSITVAPLPGGSAPNDVNGDARADLVWVDGAGNVVTQFMNGNEVMYSAPFTLAAGFAVGDVADFDGDGRSDLLLVNAATRAVSVAFFQGTGFSAPQAIGTVPSGYTLVGAARVNGSVAADIVWRDHPGRFVVWTMNGASIVSTATPAAVGGGWEVLALGDLDGDGSAELLVANNGGQVRMVKLAGPSAGSETKLDPRAPSRAVVAGLGDLDRDGRSDVVWQLPDGTLRGWRLNGATVLAEGTIGALPAGARVLRVADLSGDGRSDLVVRLASGALQLWKLNGFSVTAVQAMPPSPGGTLAGR
jgi:ELWxxDGT repeat protein